ncbi:DoxX family protein [Streptomyces iconiensis]|uniref:DoxX family protein n=1 Tax=Streptomyces iconiensis TaxID=1384038 RepID=A0ABT6ZU61_9ACTN|nr:DoxX family protein [Streptomyces iconiensis]MDJ1132402.1 DoxX family protein [Streptomyces iconiensis]
MNRNSKMIPALVRDRAGAGAKDGAPARVRARARPRSLTYWSATLIIAAESLVYGIWYVLRTDSVRAVFEQDLGYPSFAALIIGVCKVAGAVVLVARGVPRLKEWAYAGVFFLYSGAVASQSATGDPAAATIPLGFAALTAASWLTRPAPRRALSARPLPPFHTSTRSPHSPRKERAQRIGYWASTGIIAFVLLTGGFADLLRRAGTAAGVLDLGYPPYFLTLLGSWKILGTLALLAPRHPRLKEWAYAGAFFNFAGAFTSHVISGSASTHLLWTGLFTLCTLMSWALRPIPRTHTPATPEGLGASFLKPVDAGLLGGARQAGAEGGGWTGSARGGAGAVSAGKVE